MQSANQLNVQSKDTELPDGRLGPTKGHRCNSPACLTESERSRRLSSILSDYALPNTFSDAETFRARVMLRVPRRKAAPPPQASWAWYVVPVSLVCALVAGQGLLSLASTLGLITGTMWRSGAGTFSQVEPWLSEWIPSSALRGVLGSSLPILLYVVLQAAVALGLMLVFVPYVGWVTVLWRAETRPVTLEGERNGTL